VNLTLTFDPVPEDFKCAHLARRQRKGWYIALGGALIVVTLVAAASLVWGLVTKHMPHVLTIAIVVLIVGGLIFHIEPNHKRVLQRHPQRGPNNIEINDGGITIAAPAQVATVPWDQFTGFICAHEVIVLLLPEGEFRMIPVRAVHQDYMEDLQAFLQTAIPQAARAFPVTMRQPETSKRQ
jgi:hypothetical protein